MATFDSIAAVRASETLARPSATSVVAEPGRLVYETRSYGEYWFGNLFDLDEPPEDDAALARLVAEHRQQFAWRNSTTLPATIRWTCALDDPPATFSHEVEEVSALVSPARIGAAAANRARDDDFEEIAPDDEAAWKTIATPLADDDPAHAGFRAWIAGQRRSDVRSGRARWYAMREAGTIVSYAGLYAAAGFARYADVATIPIARRRGHAERLVRNMRETVPDATAIMCALLGSPAERIYERAGFAPSCRQRSIIARVRNT